MVEAVLCFHRSGKSKQEILTTEFTLRGWEGGDYSVHLEEGMVSRNFQFLPLPLSIDDKFTEQIRAFAKIYR